MRNIEKSLTNFVEGRGPKVSNEALCVCAAKSANSANEIIDILFSIINREIETITGQNTTDKLKELVKYVSMIMNNSDSVNRKIVNRRIIKLEEKIDRLKSENKSKFIDIEKAYMELDRLKAEVEKLEIETLEQESKQYEFMTYLIDAIKNVSYIEYTFKKMPALVNVKDKEENTLFQNIIIKYIRSMKEEEEEDTLYYGNLLSLILSENSFDISVNDKRKCLETLYCEVDKMSVGKKKRKLNSEKIDKLKDLIDNIQGIDDKTKEISVIAGKYNIDVFFDEELLEKAKLVREAKVGTKTDRIVVDDYIITIDGDNALEIDDGLSCRKLPNGNYLLGVHIASVLGYVPYSSELVKEAINRDRSIYLNKKYKISDTESSRVIPMFPYDFAANKASLLEGEKRFARSYFFEIDNYGNIIKEEFKKSIVTSSKRTTYDEVDNILLNGTKDKELSTVISNLQAVTEILEKRHRTTKIYQDIKENTVDVSDLRYGNIGAESIVYQCMLLTGNRVAEFFYRNSYPCLYRVHEVNEENIKKIESMVKSLNKTYGGGQYKKLYELLSGLYPNGRYDTEGAHYGLGLEHYCHCSSELRRGADIIIEHCLEVCYDKEPTEQELIELAAEIEKRKVEINSRESSIEYFVKDYKRAFQKRRH